MKLAKAPRHVILASIRILARCVQYILLERGDEKTGV